MNQSLKIILSLVMISVISLAFKLYLTDFSIPLTSDNMSYALNAISYKNGDFAQLPHRTSGWSFLLYPFFSSANSDNFLDYSVIARMLSIGISTITIPVIYVFGRKFFNEKYSLVVASLFAFEPHLNYNSGSGLAEPLFGLIIILMVYFILNKQTKYVIPSLALAAMVWWVRINGFTMFIIISIIYFISFRNKPKLFQNYGLGIVIFLVIISPMLIQRYEQFGDPLYFWYGEHIFAGSYEMTISANTQNTNPSALDYIDKNGIIPFINNFVLNGIYNILSLLAKISFPYLFIIIPFGIIFSFRAFDQDKQFLKSIWIFIILSLATMIITFAVIPERRFLYYLFPFLMVLGAIPIQRVTEYGLSTFSFSNKQKNYFLILVLIIVIVLATMFVFRYERTDHQLENEKLEFAQFLAQNLDGKVLDDNGPAMEYLQYVLIDNPPGNFQNYRISGQNKHPGHDNFDTIYLYAKSIPELVSIGKNYDLKYIISNEQRRSFHTYVDDVYHDESKYQYLVKIFDSSEQGYQKLKVKVFRINYDEFQNKIAN